MVELKNIELQGKTVLGIELILPTMVLYVIIDRQTILCDESFNLPYLIDRNPRISIIQVQIAHNFDDLLSGELTGISDMAKRRGAKLWMKGKEALEKIS